MIDLSIIIVNYNTKELLKKCIISLFNSSPASSSMEIIVVDNNSKDGSIEMVKKEFPRIKLIQNKTNLGFAKANNQAIKIAKRKYLLLLNSDTEIINNALIKMVKWLDAHKRIIAAGCQLLNSDGSIQPSGGYLPHLLKIFFWQFFLDDLPLIWKFIKPYQIIHQSFYQKEQLDVEWLTAAFLIIRKKAIEDVGLLDEDYFMYAEEVDWCYRAKKKGLKIGFNPRAQIIHKKGGSSENSQTNAIIGEYQGIINLFKKHKPKWEMPILKIILKIGAVLRWLIFLKKRRIYAKVFSVVG